MDGLTKKLVGSVPKGILIGFLLIETTILPTLISGCGKNDQQTESGGQTIKSKTKSYANLPSEQQTLSSKPLYEKAKKGLADWEYGIDDLYKFHQSQPESWIYNLLEEIVNKYPKSDYVPWALYQIDIAFLDKDRGYIWAEIEHRDLNIYKKRIRILEKLFQEYGDSEFVKHDDLKEGIAVELSIFYTRLGDLKNAEKYFAIASKDPFTTWYNFAEKEIESLRKQR